MIPKHVLDKYLEKEGIVESTKVERSSKTKQYSITPYERFELDVETALRYYNTSGITIIPR